MTIGKTIDKFGDLAITAPHWFALIAVVGGFLYYMERKDLHELERNQHAEQVSDLRIEACHDVQERGMEIMADVSKAMVQNNHAITSLQSSFDRMNIQMDESDRRIEKVIEENSRVISDFRNSL